MAKHQFPLLDALSQGQSYELHVAEDGDLASMRQALKHGQVLTLSPIRSYDEIRAGDIVFLRWGRTSYILHLVQEIQGEQFLIVNSLGKVNGWTHGSNILGRVTKIVDPPPSPEVPELLEQIQAAYQRLMADQLLDPEVMARLQSILDDLGWYAQRVGPERWAVFPRQNKLSFRWHLRHLVEEAAQFASSAPARDLLALIDHAKEHVGYVAELLILFAEPAVQKEDS